MQMRTIISSLVIIAIMGAILFVGAGTFDYWQAWLYLALGLACHLYMVADLTRRDPDLLARRRKGGAKAEPRPVQKMLIRLLIVLWLLLPFTAGWDRRFGWSHMPAWLNLAGAATYLAGQALMMWVFRTNSFARATVEVSEGQPVIETGPYALVRHPMYSSIVILALGVSLMLGSWWAVLLGLLNVPVLARRLVDEEQVMLADLPGYGAYREKVRSRLVPAIW
jgi:protein-S-isoprenylcysteine O-methyltransferase Ste14